ncbi:MAG: xanthine phosphoribosyltransferase [Clostridiales bacterium]|nr:xanthine phosphoribosyltransferase [Clostridiales bacterium]
MEALKNKILHEGQAIGSEIIKVDSFLNQQIDAQFMYEIGDEFKQRFQDKQVDKILTIEASGIAIAVCTSKSFAYPPVVFAKKAAAGEVSETEDAFYSYIAKSLTKDTTSHVKLAKKFLSAGDNVLIIDDLLAYGEAALALCDIVKQAGAHVVGIGAVIEKEFQGGGTLLRESGYAVESLAIIEKIEDGKITFKPDNL